MYIVHRDVLILYAGKSVNHPLSHMESFNISSLSVESLWLKAKPKNSNRISHLFLVLLLFMFFCCCLLVWVFLPWCCFGVFQLHLLLFLGALIDIDWMPGTKMVRHSTHMASRNCWQYKIIYVKSNKLNKIPFCLQVLQNRGKLHKYCKAISKQRLVWPLTINYINN